MVPHRMSAGDVLDRRYRLDDLLDESRSGRFWRGWDSVLSRPVAIHVIDGADDAVQPVLDAARGSARLHDRRVLRVLDATRRDDLAYVVNEWGQGASLDVLLAEGPLPARPAAQIVAEVADCLAGAHDLGLAHGRLNPENVLVDRHGNVRLIGFAVDAALHGLPPGRVRTDVDDLVGLLYAGLTGRWAGVSTSQVHAAPVEAGAVLRPRRVRAGIPRLLDGVCDQRLNPTTTLGHHRSDRDWGTARGIAEELGDFVGDPTGLLSDLGARADTGAIPPVRATAGSPPAGSAPSGADGERTQVVPTTPAPDQQADETQQTPEVRETQTRQATDEPAPGLPTEAGLPVFHDDVDEVGWVSREARAEPPPPPPFEPTPERPLFAPEPPEGRPQRQPRAGATHPSAAGASPGGASPAGASAGAAGWPPDDDDPRSSTGSRILREEPEPVPGRSWMRLAMIIGLCALLLVAMVAAFQLGGGLGVPGEDPEPSPSGDGAQSAEPAPYDDLSAEDFDPEGGPDGENPDTVAQAVDGDPATTWTTSTYYDPIDQLKSGVGLQVDLGRAGEVSAVTLELIGGTTGYAVYVNEERPDTVEGLEPVGSGQGDGTVEIALDQPAQGRYVTVWLTSLPSVEGGYRGEVAEVGVTG